MYKRQPEALRLGHVYLPPSSLEAYLEVHIEQGPVLESKGLPVGIVTGIRGNRRLPSAKCIGEYSHCGGVPRSYRKDAVLAVADLITYLDSVWDDCEENDKDFAFTVGKIFTDKDWHAMTKISGAVEFSLDMRSLDGDFIELMTKRVCEVAADIEKKRGVKFNLGDFSRAAPGPMNAPIRTRMLSGADSLGIPHMEIPSGASHDAAAFAAAGIAGSGPMRTALTSARVGIAKYVVPFAFVYNSSLLLNGPIWLSLVSFFAAFAGLWALSISLEGWYQGRAYPLQIRVFLGTLAIALFLPPHELILGLSGNIIWVVDLI